VPGPEPLSVGDQRQRLFDALAQALLSSGRPLLLMADDLHWPTGRPCGSCTTCCASGRAPPCWCWPRSGPRSSTASTRCTSWLRACGGWSGWSRSSWDGSRRRRPALAELLTRHRLREPDTERLFAETEGNPLFVIKALRAGWGSGGGGRMSPRVQAVIEARLGQLGASARGLVDQATSIGRDFTTDVLAGAGELDEDQLPATWTSCGAGGSSGNGGRTPMTSPTTGSGRSPTGR
jgi:hypothetical protein